MNRYIDADKLIAEIERRKALLDKYTGSFETAGACKQELLWMKDFISARCQVQPDMIQWTGNNLKEVIDFTGKSPRFEEWFKSWEEFETYVHQHGDILYLFCKDGSHYEVPKGAWIVKTPDGYNLPSVAKYIHKEQREVDLVEEITDKSRACCNCANGILQYPNCFCWQHKYCNTDEPYKIPKEDWIETAKTCKEFELGLNARKE